MPDMDGYEVTRRLRKNPATKDTPILMFTAKTQLDDKVTGFEAGADDYLTKPTHPAELQAHIRALLARDKSQKNRRIGYGFARTSRRERDRSAFVSRRTGRFHHGLQHGRRALSPAPIQMSSWQS